MGFITFQYIGVMDAFQQQWGMDMGQK